MRPLRYHKIINNTRKIEDFSPLLQRLMHPRYPPNSFYTIFVYFTYYLVSPVDFVFIWPESITSSHFCLFGYLNTQYTYIYSINCFNFKNIRQLSIKTARYTLIHILKRFKHVARINLPIKIYRIYYLGIKNVQFFEF
jgi:hypothetical protein